MILLSNEAEDLGSVGDHDCVVCKESRPFHLILEYRYWALYWVFGMVTKRAFAFMCLVCNRRWTIEKSEAEKLIDSNSKDPIPFMRRYGLLCLGIAIVMLVSIIMASEGQYPRRDPRDILDSYDKREMEREIQKNAIYTYEVKEDLAKQLDHLWILFKSLACLVIFTTIVSTITAIRWYKERS
jgi:hypothetical protein